MNTDTNISAYRLKRKIKQQIESDVLFQAHIAKSCGRAIETIKRWCRDDDEKLMMLSVVKAIREYLELPVGADLIEAVS